MWQVLLAAAVAGSGYFAKQLLHNNDTEPTNIPQQIDQKCHPPKQILIAETESSVFDDESIFRFSSSSGSKKKLAKKSGRGFKGMRGNLEGFKSNDVGNVKKKCGFVKCGEGLMEDQRKCGKKFAVCLKKRKTSRNACAKCDSSGSKDNSSFGYGVGVGIMYMMSAGKAEISRLNTAMDETAKVVQEMKTEIAKRKSSQNLNVSSSKAEGTPNPSEIDAKYKSGSENNDIEVYGLPITDEGECTSSVLTEEPQHEVLEMDQLEAELESELQKLPGCTTDTSYHDGRTSSNLKMEVSSEDFLKTDDPNLELYQCNGVLPSELDQKLCHLLIEQQESQIVELESALEQTNSKLCEKEVELQVLKDCVKRLTEFSLACASDEETENQVDEEKMIDGIYDKMVPELKRSMVGIKRAMDFESCDCT